MHKTGRKISIREKNFITHTFSLLIKGSIVFEVERERNRRKCRQNRRSIGARWIPETRLPAVPEATLAVVITWTRGTWRITLICAVTASVKCRAVRDVLPRTRNVLPAMREHSRNTGNTREKIRHVKLRVYNYTLGYYIKSEKNI